MKTIIWDVDDVLNDLMRLWLQDHQQKYPRKKELMLEDITRNPPHKFIGTTLEKYQDSLDRFRFSDAYETMRPNKEVMAWFKKNGKYARHMALSSVPLSAACLSSKWVLKNFGQWIRTYSFVPSLRKKLATIPYDRTKADHLKWLNKKDIVFIDDNETNVLEARKLGIKSLIYPRPWNSEKRPVDVVLSQLTKFVAGY